MLPKIDGFGVCEVIRSQSQVPILMLTALDGEAEQLRGFGLDIDDYVTKPFSMPVLLEKIRGILRRRAGGEEEDCLRCGDLLLNRTAREAFLDGHPLELTRQEFRILELLLSHPDRVFSKQEIYDYAWEDLYMGEDKTINVHISNIRKKLKACSDREYIETVWGIGFRLARPFSGEKL